MNKSPIETKKQKLRAQKERLKLQEKHLSLQERKEKTKKLIQLGSLVTKAGLDKLSSDELFGGLLELHKDAQSPEQRLEWANAAKARKGSPDEEKADSMAVSFDSPPSEEDKKVLKELKFRYNRFRDEWQGQGDLKQIKKRLKSSNVKISLV